ncbi:uncharacterized protein LOC108744246 [Agrilus planipennis]|uniref:Uncharacterized protein LOC108744246 n=1 Tax=Agrilus planipennis TaxID=224129 RepID=A0A1W4XHG4_AGRPL|nr:uncharacterized protein LOC108744246 [Agrilus planipennis]
MAFKYHKSKAYLKKVREEKEKQKKGDSDEWDHTKALNKCMSNLSTFLGPSDSKEWEEIKPLVDKLENAWQLDKLPVSIQKSVIEVSEMLRIKDYRQAELCYLAMMMECDAECKSFLAGIRRLIDKLK